MKIVCVSGGFDCLHDGHARMIEHASTYGNVIVIINSDEWLVKKKGYNLLPWKARSEIILALRNVTGVSAVDDSDGTVCEALERIKPDYFANGGDRKEDNTPEKVLCERLGIKMLWGIGGEKIRSSQEIAQSFYEKQFCNVITASAYDNYKCVGGRLDFESWRKINPSISCTVSDGGDDDDYL